MPVVLELCVDVRVTVGRPELERVEEKEDVRVLVETPVTVDEEVLEGLCVVDRVDDLEEVAVRLVVAGPVLLEVEVELEVGVVVEVSEGVCVEV